MFAARELEIAEIPVAHDILLIEHHLGADPEGPGGIRQFVNDLAHVELLLAVLETIDHHSCVFSGACVAQ